MNVGIQGDLEVAPAVVQELGKEALETLLRALAAAGSTNIRPAEHFEL